MFIRRAEELIDIRSQLEPKRISVSIKRKGDGTFDGKGSFPDEKQLESFYRLFRLFYMKKEDCNFPKVLNIIRKASNDEEINEYLCAIRSQWIIDVDDAFMEFFGRKDLSIEKIVDPWFNAYYFHSDGDKELELNKLTALFGETLSEYLLYNFVFSASLAISNLFKSIKNTSKEKMVFEIHIFLQNKYKMSNMVCINKEKQKNIYQYNIEPGNNHQEERFLITPKSNATEGRWFEILIMNFEHEVVLMNITNNQCDEFSAQGIPDAMLPEIARLKNKPLVTMPSEENKFIPEFVTDDGKKLLERLREKGIFKKDRHRDRYIVVVD